MKIVFNQDRSRVVFVHETLDEFRWLGRMPAFETTPMYHEYNSVPAVLPIVHNVVARIQRAKKKPVIDKAVQEWLDQPFKLKTLPELFTYHTKPKPFQEIALRFLFTLSSAGVLLDPGMGKSKVVLDYIHLRNFQRVIIICPRALLFVWEDEIYKHRPELTFHIISSTDWESEKQKILEKQVTIINYDKVRILKDQLKSINYEFIHVDEFLIKDPKSLRTQTITELSKGIPNRCGGSGTLINNSPLDSFAPLRYLQPSLVGWSYPNFLDKYAVQKQIKNTRQKMVVAVRDQDEIRSMLDSCCIVMTKEKWLELPPKVFEDIHVPMTEEQSAAYSSLMRNFYVNVQGHDIMVDNKLVMLSKLYQVSNGFIYAGTEESPETIGLSLEASDYAASLEKLPRPGTHPVGEGTGIDPSRDEATAKVQNQGAGDGLEEAQEEEGGVCSQAQGEGGRVPDDTPEEMAKNRVLSSKGLLNEDTSAGMEKVSKNDGLFASNGVQVSKGKSKKTSVQKSRNILFFNRTSPKVVALERLLTETLIGKRAIIWFNMEGELIQIQELLAKLGHTYSVIKGGEKDIGGKVRSFNRNQNIRWLVCQAQSVNYGITVMGSKKIDLEKEGVEVLPDVDTNVFTEIFFSIGFSLERYLQQLDRIHRLGQEHTCTYYRLFTESPIEDKIREAISNKITIKQEMLIDVMDSMLNEI